VLNAIALRAFAADLRFVHRTVKLFEVDRVNMCF